MDLELERFLETRGLRRAFDRGNFVRRVFSGPERQRCEVVLWDEGISFTVAQSVRGEEVGIGTLVFDRKGRLDFGAIQNPAGEDDSVGTRMFFERFPAFLDGEEMSIREAFW